MHILGSISINLVDIPDILVISIDCINWIFLIYMMFLNICGTYMVFMITIAVNPDT